MSLLIKRIVNNKKLYTNLLVRCMHSHSPYNNDNNNNNNNNNNNIDNTIDYTKISNCDDIKKHIDVKYDMIRAELGDLKDKQDWILIGVSPLYIYSILNFIGILCGFK